MIFFLEAPEDRNWNICIMANGASVVREVL